MKIHNKMQITSLLVTLSMVVMLAKPTMVMAAEPTVNLGTTSGFAVLAGSTITSTGDTVINGSDGGNVGGDVGLFPGTAFTENTIVTMSGEKFIAVDEAKKAQNDLVKAYDDAAGRLNVTRIPTELGKKTLKPGTYDSADGTFQITGELTLDAQGDPNAVFIFQTESTLKTATDSKINLINGARFCRIFWQVGSSATLGVNSYFVGHIFAMESITATTGAEVQGQLLARNGAVTLDNNKITNGFCETIATPEQATLTVIKHVINNDGGKKLAADFNLHIKEAGNDVVGSPALGSESGKTYKLAAGDYIISEEAFEGYTASYKGTDASGKVTLAPGESKTVTITNNDNPLPSSVIDSSAGEKPVAVTSTVTGGQLPNTSSHLYQLLLIGAALIMLGALGFTIKRRYE